MNCKKVTKITKRELEICKLLLKGKTNQEIADILFISKATVSNHRSHIKQKLKAKTAIELGAKLSLFQETEKME